MCYMEHPIAALKEKELLYQAKLLFMKQVVSIAGVVRISPFYLRLPRFWAGRKLLFLTGGFGGGVVTFPVRGGMALIKHLGPEPIRSSR